MQTSYSLHTIAKLENLGQIRDFVETSAVELGYDPDFIYHALIAVDELATNVILHGYQSQGGNLEIEVEQVKGDLILRLRDEATPFDPTTLPAPDLTLPLEKRPIGGLGVYLARRAMDEVHYRVTSTGGNEITLIKRRPDQKTSPDLS
jgi:anti-sigma regulatory factor (Ser/Thr protein kinase)